MDIGPVVNETVVVPVSPDALTVMVALVPAVVLEVLDRVTVALPSVPVVAEVAERLPVVVAKVTVVPDTLRVFAFESLSWAVRVEDPPTAGVESGLADIDRAVAEPHTVVIL